MEDRISEAKALDLDLFKYYNKTLGYTEDETADILIALHKSGSI